MRINKDSWNIINRVIRRYPESKKRYKDALDAAMYPDRSTKKSRDQNKSGGGNDYTKPVSTTEAAAMRLSNPYYDRLKKEIEAVENAYNLFDAEDQKLIQRRYWSDRNRNKPYLKIIDVSASEPTMRRICRRFIMTVGRNLGEIEAD